MYYKNDPNIWSDIKKKLDTCYCSYRIFKSIYIINL